MRVLGRRSRAYFGARNMENAWITRATAQNCTQCRIPSSMLSRSTGLDMRLKESSKATVSCVTPMNSK